MFRVLEEKCVKNGDKSQSGALQDEYQNLGGRRSALGWTVLPNFVAATLSG